MFASMGQPRCQSVGDGYPAVGYILTCFFQGFLEQYAADSIVKDMGACGRRMVDHSELIVSGEPSKPGDWPWHAALYRLQGYTMKYICGGTLLSKSFVLTGKVNLRWLRTLRGNVSEF